MSVSRNHLIGGDDMKPSTIVVDKPDTTKGLFHNVYCLIKNNTDTCKTEIIPQPIGYNK